MNRTLSCISIFVLLMIAVGVCVKQTVEFSDKLDGSTFALLLGAEAGVAVALAASGISLFRRRFARRKEPVTRRPAVEVVRA